MIFNLYAVKDELSEYASPITIQDDEQAKRYFREMCINNKMISNNPEDFSLWLVGNFSTVSGEVQPTKPRLIIRAKSFAKEEPTNDN